MNEQYKPGWDDPRQMSRKELERWHRRHNPGWTDWRPKILVPQWVMWAMYGMVVAMFLALATNAKAGEAELTWTAPTQNTDGTPLTDLAGFKIYLGTTQGGPYPVSVDIPDPLATTFTVPNLTEGTTYYFVSTAYNSAATVQESDFSNEATKLIPFSVPNPPSMLTVVEMVAFYVVAQENKYVLVAVGEVPNGTPCNPDETVNGHYVVPRTSVNWYGSVQPEAVVAKCA